MNLKKGVLILSLPNNPAWHDLSKTGGGLIAPLTFAYHALILGMLHPHPYSSIIAMEALTRLAFP